MRERNREGLRSWLDRRSPDFGEARIDKIVVKLSGRIRSESADAISSYISHLNSIDPVGTPKLFTNFGTRPPLRSSVRSDHWTIQSGDVQISGRSSDVQREIRISLSMNPTRTLQHVLGEHDFQDLARLSPREFFLCDPRVEAEVRRVTLSRSDNALLGRRNLGGAEAEYRAVRWREYLDIFEAQLRCLVIETFLPAELGFEGGALHGSGETAFGQVYVGLDWADLTVAQAEVFWERHCDSAPSVARQIANRGVAAASRAAVRLFPREGVVTGTGEESSQSRVAVARENNAYLLSVPLNRSVGVVVYAKLEDRLRFEVRYLRSVTRELRVAPSRTEARALAAWIDDLVRDALNRLPWAELRSLAHDSGDEVCLPSLIASLADALREACDRRGISGWFEPAFRELLREGGVSLCRAGQSNEVKVMERLARKGVVQRPRLLRRETGVIRWRLAGEYLGLLPQIVVAEPRSSD